MLMAVVLKSLDKLTFLQYVIIENAFQVRWHIRCQTHPLWNKALHQTGKEGSIFKKKHTAY